MTVQYIPVIVPSDIVPNRIYCQFFGGPTGPYGALNYIEISDVVPISYSAIFLWSHLGHYNRYVLYCLLAIASCPQCIDWVEYYTWAD